MPSAGAFFRSAKGKRFGVSHKAHASCLQHEDAKARMEPGADRATVSIVSGLGLGTLGVSLGLSIALG